LKRLRTAADLECAGLKGLERSPAASRAVLPHQADDLITKFSSVKGRLAMRKPDDDFGGFFPIDVSPQIKVGNSFVERLQEDGNRLRAEASSFQDAPQRHERALHIPGVYAAAQL
jgi:hypothetical protein